MGLNKRYISKDSLNKMSNRTYTGFYKYLKVSCIICLDTFSSDILKQITKCNIEDKEEIIKIMSLCK